VILPVVAPPAIVAPAPSETTAGGFCCRVALGGRPSFSAALTETLRTAHFRIHYAASGSDSIGVAYRDSLASYLEQAHERFTQGADFLLPPPRGGDDPQDPAAPVDCYVGYRGLRGHYGSAGWVDRIEGECERAWAGDIQVAPRMPPSIARNTIAHELFHTIQFRIDLFEPDWLYESTATWAAARVWPADINYTTYIPFFLDPFLPVWSDYPSLRYYACAVFWEFLDATLDDGIASRVWARACTTDWYTALTAEITEYGAAIDPLLVDFAKWNNATSLSSDDRHYWDGNRLPSIQVQAFHTSYPVASASVPESILAREAGSNYIRFIGKASRERLRITFVGDPSVAERRRVSIVASTRPNTHREWTLAPDLDGLVEFTVENWNLYDRVTMIVSNFASGDGVDSAGWRYTYSAEEIGEPAFDVEWAVSDERLRAAPNPFASATSIRFRAEDSSRPTRVTVYDAAGRAVRRLFDGEPPRGDYTVIWDGTDDRGAGASQGIYFVQVENASMLSKRLVLLR